MNYPSLPELSKLAKQVPCRPGSALKGVANVVQGLRALLFIKWLSCLQRQVYAEEGCRWSSSGVRRLNPADYICQVP
jgi:hypothetical protein